MDNETPIQRRLASLFARADELGLDVRAMLCTDGDAARLERWISSARHKKVQAEFRALVAEDGRKAERVLSESDGDRDRMLEALDQDELVVWLRVLPRAAADRVLAGYAPDTAAAIAAAMADEADLPRYVVLRSRMVAAIDPIEVNAATADRLIALGLTVKPPRRQAVGYEGAADDPWTVAGIRVTEQDPLVLSAEAWAAVLEVSAQARAMVERGQVTVDDLPVEQRRAILQSRIMRGDRRIGMRAS